jgi:tetratricopeptide (TPR) repeat protein/transcriptional regulator with XRE-family HTH domain
VTVAEAAGASEPARRDRLTARRKALGLTQGQLAERLNVNRTTVARWERGEAEPLPWVWFKLASALRVSPDRIRELLAGDVAQATASPAAPAAAVPRQLPAAVADFTGRAAELAALTRMLDAAEAGKPGTVVISAIGGTPGVGKTALALHWAHRAAGRFPDGQLHVNLRGFDPTGVPTTPAEAIRGFLDALGVRPERIPAAPEAQAALYRSVLAKRRVLVMLDNARDEQQVRPLLPASPGTMVLVTSRNQLAGLAAADGARLITLDVLSPEQAVHLLTARLGAARASAEPGAVGEIAGLCAYLPLALAVAAARAAARPRFPLAALAAELSKSADRLDALDAGDPAASVQAVFSWSYRQLSSDAARMFRLLGIHPGPDISVPAAASLAAIAKPEARRLLRELARAHLIADHATGRFAFHDLLRAYAVSQALATDTQPERDAAIGRLLDHYLHTAYAGARLLTPSRDLISLAAPGPGVTPETLAGYAQATAWFEADQQVLLAAIVLAAETGFDVHAWQIPWTMAGFLNRRGHWPEWAVSQRTAVAAATRLGDTSGQALARRSLASACRGLGEYDQALSHLKECLRLYRQLGDRIGEARVHQSLGTLAEIQSRSADSLGHHEQSLRLFQAVGHQIGQAEQLNNVGWSHAVLGDYRQALPFCQQSLTLSSGIGHRDYEASSWDSLGYIQHQLGNLREAAACYRRALRLFRELGDRRPEAVVLTHLGDACQAAGELARARKAWEQALAILEDLQHPGADHVRAKLASAGAR